MIPLNCFDIDGVVADNSSSDMLPPSVYYTNSHVKTLPPRNNMIRLVKELMKEGESYIIFLSAREEIIRQGTEEWLKQYVLEGDLKYDELIMRPTGMDFRQAPAFKAGELLKLSPAFSSIIVYEDNEEYLTIIGKVLPHAKLLLVNNDEAREFTWWER